MTYQYIKPTEKQIATMQNFRDKFESLHKEILDTINATSGCYQLDYAFKALREASMWLNKAITEND